MTVGKRTKKDAGSIAEEAKPARPAKPSAKKPAAAKKPASAKSSRSIEEEAKPMPMAVAPTGKISRRGRPTYDRNPFIVGLKPKTSTRRIADTQGEKFMVIAPSTGEIVGASGFWHTQEVDRTQFVKLYVNGVKAFKELSKAGSAVFEILYLELQRNIGRDKVVLNYNLIDQDITPIALRTFMRGMSEMVEKGFIAESVATGVYFVNPDYVWNGDRLAFVKEFRLKEAEAPNQQLDLLDGLDQEQQQSPSA